MEDGIWSARGYCAPCKFNNCDTECMEPQKPKLLQTDLNTKNRSTKKRSNRAPFLYSIF